MIVMVGCAASHVATASAVRTASTRASFYLYTTPGEIDALVEGVERAKRFFG